MNRRLLTWCLWSGTAFAVIFGIGFALLAQFFPPPSPQDTAQEVVAMYRDNLDGIRWGTVLMMLAVPLVIPFGIAITVCITDRALAISSAICAGIVCFTIVLFTTIWAVAAFRPGVLSADTTQALNDLAFFLLLFDFGPFAFWCVTIAVACFVEGSRFPRWLGYLNAWIAVLALPGALIVFFKEGAFAFNGLMAYYVVVIAFFVWLVAMTICVRRALQSA